MYYKKEKYPIISLEKIVRRLVYWLCVIYEWLVLLVVLAVDRSKYSLCSRYSRILGSTR